MNAKQNEFEVTVFHIFTAKLILLQQQLDKSYHSDTFLRDSLLTAVDIPAIQARLRDRFPRSSQQAINRVAIQLSEQKDQPGEHRHAWPREENETRQGIH